MVNHYFHLPQRHPQQVFFGPRFLSQQEIIFSVAQRYEEKATTAKSEEKELTQVEQYAILETSSNYVKKGGYLYYSTCSVFKCENQLNVDKFLENHKDFIQEDIDSKLPNLKVGKGVQFLPHISGGGFFVAKLKKIN